MKALVIVDIQNDFLPKGALAVPHGDSIIPLVNALQEKFSLIVATKDWHPKGHVSFASTHGKRPGEILLVGGDRQILWPDHCVQNTFGAEFPSFLHIEKISQVFYKGSDLYLDSYSAFYDNAHKKATGLGEYLKSCGVKELYFVGLATDYCVKFSVLDAIREGFRAYVIQDGCMGIDPDSSALAEMQQAGAIIIDSSLL